MQVCFFAISGVLPRDEAIEAIKNSIRKTYGKKGEEIVADEPASGGPDARPSARGASSAERNQHASRCSRRMSPGAPKFVHDVLGIMIAGHGDGLPVSALPCDGTFPTGTAQ